jgi:hypothetical protein
VIATSRDAAPPGCDRLLGTSVPSQRYVAKSGEPCALLARRFDDEYSSVFGGEATPPAARRAGEIGNVFLTGDTRQQREISAKIMPIHGILDSRSRS